MSNIAMCVWATISRNSGSVIYLDLGHELLSTSTYCNLIVSTSVLVADNTPSDKCSTSANERTGTIRKVQNPIYGDNMDGSAQQDQLYSIPQTLPSMSTSLGAGEKGPGYDHRYAAPNGEMEVKKNSVDIQVVAHEYAIIDEAKKTKNELFT